MWPGALQFFQRGLGQWDSFDRGEQRAGEACPRAARDCADRRRPFHCLHLGIQILLLLLAVLAFGLGVNIQWLWLPLVWALEIVFVCGLALLTSAINVYIRDMRYVVESVIMVMFWLVPIFYGFENIPPKYAYIYELNPVAALILALRSILLHAAAPHTATVLKLAVVSAMVFAIGWVAFRRMKDSFYEHI